MVYEHFPHEQHIYPSQSFRDSYNSNTPEIFAAAVAATFGLVALVFFMYDVMVNQRNENLVNNAAQSHAIINGLFPGQIRDRLLENNKEARKQSHTNAASLKSFLNVDHKGENESSAAKPLADLFLETTCCFCDIVGKFWLSRVVCLTCSDSKTFAYDRVIWP